MPQCICYCFVPFWDDEDEKDENYYFLIVFPFVFFLLLLLLFLLLLLCYWCFCFSIFPYTCILLYFSSHWKYIYFSLYRCFGCLLNAHDTLGCLFTWTRGAISILPNYPQTFNFINKYNFRFFSVFFSFFAISPLTTLILRDQDHIQTRIISLFHFEFWLTMVWWFCVLPKIVCGW